MIEFDFEAAARFSRSMPDESLRDATRRAAIVLKSVISKRSKMVITEEIDDELETAGKRWAVLDREILRREKEKFENSRESARRNTKPTYMGGD